MFESLPTYPDAGRYWDMVQRHKITQFYTAPTAVRALMKYGDGPVKKYDRSSLRVLGSVGEPINPEAWKWYFEVLIIIINNNNIIIIIIIGAKFGRHCGFARGLGTSLQ
jgi:acyl-coenzyme A synthetase/AMP-(fatty) acid ligase